METPFPSNGCGFIVPGHHLNPWGQGFEFGAMEQPATPLDKMSGLAAHHRARPASCQSSRRGGSLVGQIVKSSAPNPHLAERVLGALAAAVERDLSHGALLSSKTSAAQIMAYIGRNYYRLPAGGSSLSATPPLRAQVLGHRAGLDQPVVPGLEAWDDSILEKTTQLPG